MLMIKLYDQDVCFQPYHNVKHRFVSKIYICVSGLDCLIYNIVKMLCFLSHLKSKLESIIHLILESDI